MKRASAQHEAALSQAERQELTEPEDLSMPDALYEIWHRLLQQAESNAESNNGALDRCFPAE